MNPIPSNLTKIDSDWLDIQPFGARKKLHVEVSDQGDVNVQIVAQNVFEHAFSSIVHWASKLFGMNVRDDTFSSVKHSEQIKISLIPKDDETSLFEDDETEKIQQLLHEKAENLDTMLTSLKNYLKELPQAKQETPAQKEEPVKEEEEKPEEELVQPTIETISAPQIEQNKEEVERKQQALRFFHEGEELKRSGDYERALESYKEAANLGDDVALCAIALLYENFQVDTGDVRENLLEAKNYFSQAAVLGNSEGWLGLGYITGYLDNVEYSQSWYGSLRKFFNYPQQMSEDVAKESFNYFIKAAELGEPDAMRVVGQRYEEGRGVEQDLAKAEEWLQKSRQFSAKEHIDLLKPKSSKSGIHPAG